MPGEARERNTFRAMMTENIPKLMSDTVSSQEAQRTPDKNKTPELCPATLSSNHRKSKIRQNYSKKPERERKIRPYPASLQKLQKRMK